MLSRQLHTLYHERKQSCSVEDSMYVAVLGIPLTVVNPSLAATWILLWLFVIPFCISLYTR